MKKRFFKRVAAFVVASLMALGVFTVLPEDYRRILGTVVSAEEAATNGQCGDNAYWTLDNNGVLTISGTGNIYDNYEFMSYSKIVSIIIDEGITSIGTKSFAGLYNLKSVYLPTTMQTIGASAFYLCTSLSDIDLPNGLIAIRDGAFNSCESLQRINIPSSVTSIGDSAFLACDNLSSIEVNLGNSYFTSVDGVLFTKDMKTIIKYPAQKPNTEYSIPSTVTFIKDAAFWECLLLKKVDIPDSVTYISRYAFYGCSSLDNIYIPDSVTNILDYAFADCTSLSNIKLSSVSHISTGLFEDCSSLENITIPYGVQSIDNYAFSHTAIKDIVIPNSVVSIIEAAFYACDSLTSITIPQSVTQINNVIYSIHYWQNYTIYGYSGSYIETYAKENNYNFVALDGNEEFTSATMTQFTSPVNVGDELLFNVVIRDSNGKPVKISDMAIEPAFTTSVSNTSCIRIDSESINETGAFIEATAIGEGTATVTVTFSNGVSATSTVKVGKSETGDDNTDTSSDSRYEKLHLIFEPKNISYTYNADTESFNVDSTDCEITLSCLVLLQTGLFMDVNKIVITPPKGFSVNGLGERVPHEYSYSIPKPINGGSDGDLSEHFVLYPPTKEFLDGNPLTDSYKAELTITVYGDDDFVKTFKQEIRIKRTSTSPKNAIDVSEEYDETDTDGDGLPDVWETNGITYNGELLDLPAMGADPYKPDIFVEVDWMNGYNPADYESALKVVYLQFKNHGINLHIDAGYNSEDYVTGDRWGKLSSANEINMNKDINMWLDYINKKPSLTWKKIIDENFMNQKSRSLVFRYCIMGQSVIDTNGKRITGLAAEIPSQYFIVSLGLIQNKIKQGNDRIIAIAGTFMHELGHTLGLHHGGLNGMGISDDTNYKPNYLSIMNYSFQTSGLEFLVGYGSNSAIEELSKFVNYSEYGLLPLEEKNLNENLGIDYIGVTKGTNLRSKYYLKNNEGNYDDRFTMVIANEQVDFNGNNEIESSISLDINRDGKLTVLAETSNDWIHIIYNGGCIGGNGAALNHLLEIFNTNEFVFDIPEEAPADELFKLTDEIPITPTIPIPDIPSTDETSVAPTIPTPNVPVTSSTSTSSNNTITPTNSTISITFNVKVENKITGKTNKAKATRTGENVTVDVGKENNDYYANIYTTDGNLLDSVKIKSGKAKFTIQNDTDFYIIIDKNSHLEYEDVSSGAGIYALFEDKKEPFCMIVIIIAAVGFSSILIIKRFSKNKQ